MGERRHGDAGWESDGFQGVEQRMEPPAAERRLVELMEEFRGRQRRRPDLVVRPWWTPVEGGLRKRVGFVVEYCPTGRTSAEVIVRLERVTVDGPGGVVEARLDLGSGWWLDGTDTRSPQTMANYLLRLADRALAELLPGDATGDAA